jgi:hypothetical protein
MESDSDKENDEHSEFPVVTDDVPVQYIAGKQGKGLLVDPFNYVYVKMKSRKDKTYWRCQRDISKLCPR